MLRTNRVYNGFPSITNQILDPDLKYIGGKWIREIRDNEPWIQRTFFQSVINGVRCERSTLCVKLSLQPIYPGTELQRVPIAH